MEGSHVFIRDLALILGTAAATLFTCRALKLPVVLGYLVAGLIVAPLVRDRNTVSMLSEQGVTLLMFSIGLGFNLRKLFALSPTAGLIVLIEVGLLTWLGYTAAILLNWTPREAVFAAAMVAITSTMIVAKFLAEHPLERKLHDLVMGVLIVEDLVSIALLAVLTAVGQGAAVAEGELGVGLLKLFAFLGASIVVGLLLVPPVIRTAIRLGPKETVVVTTIGICFAFALAASHFGYSVALGAFLAGAMAAESGEARFLERLIDPIRDLFGAIFFVTVGMLIDPRVALEQWVAVLVFAGVAICGKLAGITLGAFLTGHGTHNSARAATTLAQLGEFSFVVAAMGAASGATRDFLLPIAVAVSVITVALAPWLQRLSDPLARLADRWMPPTLQTFETTYRAWLEGLKQSKPAQGNVDPVRRAVLWLALDTALLSALLIALIILRPELVDLVARIARLPPGLAQIVVHAAGALVTVPFWIGILRGGRRIATAIAERAMPNAAPGKFDLALAPRRALMAGVQFVVFLAIGLFLLAVTQPFLPSGPTAGGLIVLVVVLGYAFWRNAKDLQGHLRAGAQVLVEAITRKGIRSGAADIAEVRSILPGLGAFVSVAVEPGCAAIGKRLDDLNLPGQAGCSVVAIVRSGKGVLMPQGEEELFAGDVLALAGSQESVDEARKLLLRAEDSAA